MSHRTSPASSARAGVIALAAMLSAVLPSPSRAAPAARPRAQAASAASAASAAPRIAATREAWHRSLLQACRRLPHRRLSADRVESRPLRKPARLSDAADARRRFAFRRRWWRQRLRGLPDRHHQRRRRTFPSISSGLTESGPIANTPPSVSNAYTLQINSNQFTSAACAGSPNPNCKGWEQFVYENNNVSHRAFIQYWLIQYNAACPSSAWTQFGFSGGTDIYCYQSTSTASLTAGQPVSSFGSLTFAAAVTSSSDQVTISTGTEAATRVGLNAVGAAAGWTAAESNVFGDGGNSKGGGEAGFGASSVVGLAGEALGDAAGRVSGSRCARSS